MNKKGLSAFLKKKKQQTSSAKTEEPTEGATQETESKTLQDEKLEEKVQVVTQSKTQKKAESSDEEEDDTNLNAGLTYGKVAEKQDESVTQAQEEENKANAFSLDQEEPKAQETKKEKKTASNITFGGGKPTFMKRGVRAVAIDKNDGELADLLEEGPSTKKQEKKAMLARENMATAVKKEPEAVSQKGPSKPTFSGKLNLRGAGADTSDSGVKTDYSFTAKYKSDVKEDDKPKQKREKPQTFNISGGKMGPGFAAAEAQAQSQVDEDGFEIVGGGNDRKARRQIARNRQDEKQDDDDFKIVRNEKRGGAFHAMND